MSNAVAVRAISRIILSFAILFGAAGAAQAVTISFDGDDYALGTDVTNLFRGMTISTQSQSRDTSSSFTPTASPTQVRNLFGTPAIAGGGDLFTIHSCFLGADASCLEGFSFLEFVLARPTDYFAYLPIFTSEGDTVMIFFSDGRYWNNAGLSSTVAFAEYCVTPESVGLGYGTRTQDLDTVHGGGCVVRDGAPLISRIWIQGSGFIQGAAEFEYNVPEPGTLALLGLGLAGLGFARRRKPG